MRKQTSINNWLYLILVGLGVSPFFKGLFPPFYQLIAIVLMLFAVATYFAVRSKRVGERLVPLDYAILALAGLYVLANIWGVNHRSALQEALKQTFLVGTYWVVSRSCTDRKDVAWFLKAVGAVMTAVAVGTVVIAAGWVPYFQAVLDNRVAGPFQYPNTMAGYLLLGLGITLGVRSTASNTREAVVWGLALSAQSMVFLFTYSRIAWAVAPVVLLAALVLAPKANRAPMLSGLVSAGVGVAVSLVPVDTALRTSHVGILPVWFALGLAVSAVMEWLLGAASKNRMVKRGLFVAGGLAIMAAAVLVAPRATQLVQRLQSLFTSGGDNSLTLRLWTYRDALSAWAHESPVLGMGGGGWKSVYMVYRSFNFVSKVTHSSVLETLTEVGVQGVVLLLAGWVLGLRSAWRALRENSISPALTAGTMAGLIGLMLHSSFDFDLWYPALGMALYATLGALRALEETRVVLPKEQKPNLGLRYGVAGVAVLLALGTISLSVSAYAANQGVTLYAANKPYQEVQSAFGRSAAFDPLNGTARAQYGDLLVQVGQQTNAPAMMEQGGRELQTAVALDPRNADFRVLLATYYAASGDPDKALQEMAEANRLNSRAPDTYQKALRQGLIVLADSLSKGNNDRAKVAMQTLSTILNRFDAAVKSQPANVPTGNLPKADPIIELARAEYLVYAGQFSQAKAAFEALQPSADPAYNKERLVWVSVVHASLGDITSLNASMDELRSLDPQLTTQVPVVQSLVSRAVALH